MKFTAWLTGVLAFFLLLATACPPAFADRYGYGHPGHGWHGDIRYFHDHDYHRWRGGHWNHGWHRGYTGWWWVVGGLWYFYSAPVYPYPDPYVPPVVVEQAPPVVQQAPAPAAPQYWYYCEPAKTYYPYVTSCPAGWTRVPATPPATPQSTAPQG